MTPDLQQLIQQAQENAHAAAWQATFLAYSTWVAIIVCAVSSVLMFWKLCQIYRLLQANCGHQSAIPPAQPYSGAPPDARPARPAVPIPDDSRYMPRR